MLWNHVHQANETEVKYAVVGYFTDSSVLRGNKRVEEVAV